MVGCIELKLSRSKIYLSFAMQNVLIRPQTVNIQPSHALNANQVIQFQERLHEAVLAHSHANLLVDMGQVESIDSAGLMVLVAALTTAQRLNKRLALCSVSQSVRMIFELTQLDRVFDIFDGHAVAYDAIA